MELNRPFDFTDEHDLASAWATGHEFQMRRMRYLRYLGGGLVGAMARLSNALVGAREGFTRA